MKKIMFLGGAHMQLPAIKYAKEQGYNTILCDYLSDNPGQYYADEYYCVSTTDKESVLKIAEKKKIDGIFSYVSDPAVPTVAYVANKLNLPSNPYSSVMILSKKDLFRKFLVENGFNCPRAESYETFEEAKKNLYKFKFPIMVKPVDSSASRGISQINTLDEFEFAFHYALSYSRDKMVIVEEYIEIAHDYQIGGDVFIIDGMLEFCGLLNCHRNKLINPFIPVGKSFPVILDQKKVETICNEVQRMVDLLGIKMGALNIEVIFGKGERPYFIEVGPRNGGNMISNFLEIITGTDFVKASVDAALGNLNRNLFFAPKEGFYGSYTLHSYKQGRLGSILFSNEIEGNIVHKFIYKEKGEEIDIFNGGDKSIGYVFLKFNSLAELISKMNDMNRYIQVQVI